MYENRRMKSITNCFKWGGVDEKENNGGGFYQSSLYACVETSNLNHFARLIYVYKKKKEKKPCHSGDKVLNT
jgi:hypothetical protein